MKIQKRDGSYAEYDESKVVQAVMKAGVGPRKAAELARGVTRRLRIVLAKKNGKNLPYFPPLYLSESLRTGLALYTARVVGHRVWHADWSGVGVRGRGRTRSV